LNIRLDRAVTLNDGGGVAGLMHNCSLCHRNNRKAHCRQ
jgi:hypothetical protein